MKRYTAYAIGAALVDTELEVTDADLAAMNVEKGMMTLVDEARQAELLSYLKDHMVRASHASGGSSGNSMIATASFGAPTYMSCKVAHDEDGEIYIGDLEGSGVSHNLRNVSGDGTTGKCIVLVTPDAERSMNTFLGVSETLSVTEINEEAIVASEWVFLEGYLVTSPTGHAAAVRTAEIAKAHGVKTAISFADPGMVMYFRENLEAMIGDGMDLVFCNKAEALEWGQTQDMNEAIQALKKVTKTFVITLGAKGAITWDGESLCEIEPHWVDEVRNTNGAGDMFAGAFLYALSRGESYERAGQFAARCSAELVRFFGPRLKAEEYRALRLEFFGD